MEINSEKLKKLQGLNFNKIDDNLLFYIQGTLYFLKTHNKNYTKKQYEKICMLYDIFDCVEV